MATHFITLAWEIPQTEEPGGLQPVESQKSWTRLSNSTARQEQIILMGYRPEERRELMMEEGRKGGRKEGSGPEEGRAVDLERSK